MILQGGLRRPLTLLIHTFYWEIFEDPCLPFLPVSMHVEIDHWMSAIFELDRHKASLWRRPLLVMTQLESPDAAGWWQLTSSRWRAVHEHERQPELIRPDFRSGTLSSLQTDLAHCWALLWSLSSRLSQVQPGHPYPSSILAFSPLLSSTIKNNLFLKLQHNKSSYLGTDFFCWYLHATGIK